MLKVKVEMDGRVFYKNILVIDAHSHMGKDVDQAEMMNPMQPGHGTFDFWTLIENRILQDWEKKNGSPNFSTKIQGKPAKLSIEFEQHPLIKNLFEELDARNKSQTFGNLVERSKYQRLIDQSVCFPFQDIFRDKMPEALYRASNLNISRQVSKFPISLRMIGYMRCNPMEGQKAVDEVEYWARTGSIRGLKLHPRSEAWVDKVNSTQAVQVLMKAAQYNLPVIFDTRGKQTIMDIAALIQSTRQTLQAQNPSLLNQFKVIIAHFAQGNVDDHEIYNVITQPNTWGDLSMLHGQGTAKFLQSFREYCQKNRIKERTGRDWSDFLLFATDYPYFGDMHAKEQIVYLFNQSFFESGGTIEDSEKILGLNQLKLLPEYGMNYTNNNPVVPFGTMLQSTDLIPMNIPSRPKVPLTPRKIMLKTLAGLIDDGIIEIQKVLFQFNGSWENYQGDLCIFTYPKNNPNKIMPLVYMQMLPDKIGTLCTIPQGFRWKKFGYKYFDPEDNAFFKAVFAQNYPVTNELEAESMLSKLYQ